VGGQASVVGPVQILHHVEVRRVVLTRSETAGDLTKGLAPGGVNWRRRGRHPSREAQLVADTTLVDEP